tara:strand:+ start:8049 stop:8720 length:672 start_codon:yes stop_codon:yes gene_type:complete
MAKKRNSLGVGFTDIELSKLIKADWNYKEEEEDKSQKLTENFKRNGQIENILIRELDTGFFEVVNGNHRLDVMNKLKLKKAHAYNLGTISLAQAQRIAIETNETKFSVDNVVLGGIIKEMLSEFNIEELSKTMAYSENELENLSKLSDFDWEAFESDEEGISLDAEQNDAFVFKIEVEVTKETYERWLELKDKLAKVTGWDNESKVLEYAIQETLSTPLESFT